ncbi:MAG: hypothetical protein JXA94_06330 [Parachlamydiales bacterium]|nr:hypothetical protein [Parachlamydiales bacterium]
MIICIQNNPWGRNDFLFNINYLNLINSTKRGIIVAIPKESYHFLLIKYLLQTPRWQKYADLLIDNNFSLDNYRSLLIKKYNLNILHFQIEKKLLTYNDKQSLKASIGDNIHYFIKLPNILIDEFINDLTNIATKHRFKFEDEKIHIPYQVLTIIFDKNY